MNTPGCRIPDIDPYDVSIRHLLLRIPPILCNATPPITYTEGDALRLNNTALQLYYTDTVDYCQYQAIYRVHNNDNSFTYGHVRLFSTDINISEDFIRVACYGTRGDMIYTNFHAFVHVNESFYSGKVKQFTEFVDEVRPKETLNVLMVGIDSVSRLNFIRQMTKTRRYLINKMHAVELKGYNKVADNTYVNLVPMFAGKFVEELPWDESFTDIPFDNFSFIWKNFSDQGYATLLAEDAPNIAIFNFNKAGFHKKPMDYYLRPFSLAVEDHGSIWKNGHHCIGSKLETEVVLDYTKEFIHQFKNNPYFAFSFLTRLTHDGINKAGAADEPYYDFISSLHQSGALENTLLVFFSDHGMRFGPIRESYSGKMEERLPFMAIALPQWFKHKYPSYVDALVANSHRLTTPFDIHETLRKVLRFPHEEPRNEESQERKRSYSLFSPIPRDRTCEDAYILPHWCTCHEQEPVLLDNPVVTKTASTIVATINSDLEIFNTLCSKLTMDAITDARKMKPNDKVLRFKSSIHDVFRRTVMYGDKVAKTAVYLVTVRTQPGGALFEATVQHREKEDSYSVVGDISRINQYEGQSDCIQTHRHKRLCYCM